MGDHSKSSKSEFIVICQSAWMNETGFGINYGWDGERFARAKDAIRHGLELRGSDDFNIGEVKGGRLVWFGWMDTPLGEPDDVMAEIAEAIGLRFAKPARSKAEAQP